MELYSATRFIMLIALFAANIFGVHNHLVKADVDYPSRRNLGVPTPSPPPPPIGAKPPGQRKKPPKRSPTRQNEGAHLPPPPSS